MRSRYTATSLLILSLLSASAQNGLRTPHATPVALTARGGAPVNDLCSSVTPDALAIGGSLTWSGTTVGTTLAGDYTPGSVLDGFAVPVVWHAFTTTTCANVKVEYCGTTPAFSEYWNVLTLDCPATDAMVVSFNYNTTDCPDGNPTVYFDDLPAGTYYYPVWSEDPGANGPYTIAVSASVCTGGPTAPVNDQCADVTPQTLDIGSSLDFSGDNTGATGTNDFAPDSPFDASVVWHAFTTTACADVTVSYCGQAPTWTNTYGFLSTDCPSDSVVLFSTFEDTTCTDGNTSYHFIDLAAGTYYLPVLLDPTNNAEGPYTIQVSAEACSTGPVGPVNDLCSSVTPQALAVGGSIDLSGDNTGATATNDFAPGSPFLGSPVVWHAFTTAECADVTVSYCGQTPTWENTFGFLSTDCPSDSVVFFSTLEDTTCTDGNTSYHFADLAAGTYYLPVLLDPANNAEGAYTIQVSAEACGTGPVGPVNDLCSSVTPQALAVGSSIDLSGDNTGATATNDFTPDSPFFGAPVVWHAFTTAECADVTVSYCGQTPTWENTFGFLSTDCPSDSVVFFSTLEDTTCTDGNITYHFASLAAGTYYVPVLLDPANNAAGPYTIQVAAAACSGPVVPVNDLCSSVTPQPIITGIPVVLSGDNTGATATDDFAAGSPFLGAPVVWHAFTTSVCSDLTVSYCGQTPTWENTLGILSVDCPADSVIFFTSLNDTTCADGNLIYGFEALAPGTYYLPVLFDPANAAVGPYNITLSATVCDGVVPLNDTCTAVIAEALAVGGSITLQGDNTNATDNEGLGYASAWEGFTLTECAQVTIQYCGTQPAFGTVAEELYTSCPPGEAIAATAIIMDGCGPDDTNTGLLYDGLAPGTYYIPVLMEPGVAEGGYTLTVSAAACVVPPVNDVCDSALTVDVVLPTGCDTATVMGDNTYATQAGLEPECGFPGSPFQDVWYTFNSGEYSEVTIALTAGSIVGAGVEVFSTCSDTSIYCSQENGDHVVAVEPGTDYLVRIYSFTDLGEAGTFMLCVQGDPDSGTEETTMPAFGLFPNPSDGNITVAYAGEAADATIQLFDLTGRTVHSERAHLVRGQQRVLSLAGTLAAGTYALRITTPFGATEQRVVIK